MSPTISFCELLLAGTRPILSPTISFSVQLLGRTRPILSPTISFSVQLLGGTRPILCPTISFCVQLLDGTRPILSPISLCVQLKGNGSEAASWPDNVELLKISGCWLHLVPSICFLGVPV